MEQDPLVYNIQQTGVVFTIVKLINFDYDDTQPVYLEVRSNQDSPVRSSLQTRSCRRTRLVEVHRPIFNDSFHYNTSQLVDDNIIFVLRKRDGTQMGRFTQRNLKFWLRDRIFQRQVQIKNGNTIVAEMLIRVDFKSHQEVISGIKVPDLSLVPKYPFNPKYNALDGYNPNLKSNRANCFSFFDGDHIPGFDNIDVFPAKYVLPKDLK